MGIYNKDEMTDYIENLSDPWDGKSGLAVEDFICRNIDDLNKLIENAVETVNENITELSKKQIASGSYDGTKLILKDHNEDEVVSVPVTVVPPEYEYDIVLYGIRVSGDNTVYNSTEALILYKKATLLDPATIITAGVGIRSVTKLGNDVYERNLNVPVNFSISSVGDTKINKQIVKNVKSIGPEYFTKVGNKYDIVIPVGKSIEDLEWIDITELFTTKYNIALLLSAQFTYTDKNNTATYSSKLATNITVEFLDIQYTGLFITNLDYFNVSFVNTIQQEIRGSQYQIIGYNVNDLGLTFINESITNNLLLIPGLNKIVVRAEHKTNKKLSSDWLKFDIISTSDFKGTAVAVNGISSHITNNGVATLYRLDVYSSNREEFELITYLENSAVDEINPNPTNIIKQEIISTSSYDRETSRIENLKYQKYMEITNSDLEQYLYIKVDNKFYQFISVSYSNLSQSYSCLYSYNNPMLIEPCEVNYTYIKHYNISHNFDQITGLVNNVFSTYQQKGDQSTLIPNLLECDGWKENEGLTYLKLSKQNKDILRNPISFDLSSNFTIELGFRTYNISDNALSILNIGNFVLFPTLFGYLDSNSSITSDSFLKTNALFLANQKTHLLITVLKNWAISKSDAYYPDYLDKDLDAFDEKIVSFNRSLARIYVNGGIDREIILSETLLNSLLNTTMQINPKSADIDLFLFRVYNTQALTGEEVIRNYISFIPEKTGVLSKESIYNKNNILDQNGRISWSSCLGKQNTLLFIYHTSSDGKKGRFPNRFWGQADNKSDNDWNKKIPCTLIINYADPLTNLKYGGILDKLLCKGQGSSAMRYLIWNVNSSLNKFKTKVYDEQGNPVLDEDGEQKEKKVKSTFKPFGQIYKEQNITNLIPDASLQFESIEGYYAMPPYEGEEDKTEYKYTKMVGKVNFASSMQSHKIGACKLYDDAYKAQYKLSALPSGGKKAVHEEPFMYFYIETDIKFDKNYDSELSASNLQYLKILELGAQAKFMGFLTWGPGKGDEACSGYDEDLTPEYLLLEGGENKEPIVNFQRPWLTLLRLDKSFVRNGLKYDYGKHLLSTPTVTKQESIEQPWSLLLIDDESIVYLDRGAWDIDFGFSEDEVGDTTYFDFAEGAKKSLKVFREFFDTVYLYDPTFIYISNLNDEDTTTWSIYKKYCIGSSGTIKLSYKVSSTGQIITKEYSTHKAGDVYRFDEPTNSWVPAGLYYNGSSWERLNYVELLKSITGQNYQLGNTESIKKDLSTLFKYKMAGHNDPSNPSYNEEGYLNVDDVAFHQAFVKFLSGTDNRAKNTYFLIIGKLYSEGVPTEAGDYKIRMLGDDLDTILVTDNNGLQSKPYNLVEDSYFDESDPEFAEITRHWGDAGNLFFRSFDKVFEIDIQRNLNYVMTKASIMPDSINTKGGSYFYNLFFNVQESFPEIAYNHTALIYYENAYAIKNCGAGYSFDYTNNDIDPISLSHGSCIQCEKLFMKERVNFLAGYAKCSNSLGNTISLSSSAASNKSIRLKIDFVPNLDFYPVYFYDSSIKRIGNDYDDSGYELLDCKVTKGLTYSKEVKENAEAINSRLYLTDLYKELTITGLLANELGSVNFGSLTSFTIDNDLLKQNSHLFEADYPQLTISDFPKELPTIEHLNLRNIVLGDKLDLSTYYKLQTLDLTGSSVKELIFPQSNSLKSVILPSSLEVFEIYNNPGLESVDYSNCLDLSTIYIDCAKSGNFDIELFLLNINKTSLNTVTIKNLNNLNITEETLMDLLNSNCDLQGSITIINSSEDKSPKEIGFKTLKKLVDNFGDIRDSQNTLKVNFASRDVTQSGFKYPEEVNAYYPGVETIYNDIIDIDFTSGNNIAIKDGHLDIVYTAENFPSSATLDPITGAIKVTLTEDTNAARIKIVIKLYNKVDVITNVVSGTTKTAVNFIWSLPKVGDFAYSDGTFSNKNLSSKTLVGMVYKCDYDETSGLGTAYIFGKEYSSDISHFIGPLNKTSDLTDQVSMGFTVDKLTKYVLEKHCKNLNITDSTNLEIKYSDETISCDSFKLSQYLQSMVNENFVGDCKTIGQKDTKAYVQAVHDSDYYNDILTVISKRYPNDQLLDSNNNNKFKDINSLNKACEVLSNSQFSVQLSGTTYLFEPLYNSALLYPYFYSAYLYEPEVGNNQLDELYKKTNWYAPSIYEMSIVLFYRLLSTLSPSITTAIKDDIYSEKSSDPLGTPIFSLALKKLGNNGFPDVWKHLINTRSNGDKAADKFEHLSYNAVTTTTNPDNWGFENYSYAYGKSYWEQGIIKWIAGNISEDENMGAESNNYYDSEGFVASKLHRYNKFQGIPFTHYNFKKPV